MTHDKCPNCGFPAACANCGKTLAMTAEMKRRLRRRHGNFGLREAKLKVRIQVILAHITALSKDRFRLADLAGMPEWKRRRDLLETIDAGYVREAGREPGPGGAILYELMPARVDASREV